MADIIKTHVLVVGGGPGGYVAAIRAGQLGLDTTIVEADRLGGTCLIRGCIPSKAIIHVAEEFETMRRAAEKARHGISLNAQPALDMAATVKWKETVVDKLNTGVAGLLKRAKVRAVAGWATFSDGKTCSVKTKDGDVTIHADHVILANGSLPVELPFLKFGGNVISSTEALALDTLPKNLVVVGAGYIGLELGIAFAKFGVNVTVVEALDRILPLYDKELTDPVRKWLEKHGVTVHLGAKAKGASKAGLTAEMADGKTADLPADKILVTVGRRPNTQGWGLENMAVDMAKETGNKFIRIDDQCRTSMKNVWAIGDITGEPMLAHRASAQGEMVAEIIAGHKRRFDPVAIAAVCFTEPEIVSAGKLPSEAPDAIVAKFPLVASGRALSMDATDGFVRIVADKANHRLLGIQAVGSHVSELSAEFALALEMGATLEDIAGTIHVHPTLSEAFHESALLGLYGHAIHI